MREGRGTWYFGPWVPQISAVAVTVYTLYFVPHGGKFIYAKITNYCTCKWDAKIRSRSAKDGEELNKHPGVVQEYTYRIITENRLECPEKRGPGGWAGVYTYFGGTVG